MIMNKGKKWVGWAATVLAVLCLLLPSNVVFILARMCVSYHRIPPAYEILDTIPLQVIGIAALLLVAGIATLTLGIRSIKSGTMNGDN
jgi:hypothetical protein